MPIYNRRQPVISRPKPGNLVDRNRSVRDILKDRREKEKLHQQQILQTQNTIKEEKEDSKKEHQFIIDEMRAKTRVAVEEKRAERNKHRSVEVIVPAKLNNHLTPPIA